MAAENQVNTEIELPQTIAGSSTTTDVPVSIDHSALYWVYHKGTTLGPINAEKIKLQYMIGNISKNIHIAPFMNGSLDLRWDEVELPPLLNKTFLKKQAEDDGEYEYEQLSDKDLEEYKTKCDHLKSFLLSDNNAQSDGTYLVQPPDIDKIGGGYKSLSFGGKISYFGGKALRFFSNFIGFIHLTPMFAVSCFFLFFACCFNSAETCLDKSYSSDAVLYSLMAIHFLSIPSLVVYFGFINSNVYDELQSWHIAYIAWGTSLAVFAILSAYFDKSNQDKFDKFLWSLIGVKTGDTKKGYDDPSWFIVACLPAVVAGFIANYIFEEKFLLECDYKTGDICFDDGRGCCVVISSHNLSNFYDFMGGLFSNILAAYAFIRVCGWILALGDLELRAYAKKQK